MTPPTPFPAKIGLGTWKMGESPSRRQQEADAVLHALALGYRLIDTAEMYGAGGAERVVGEALQRFGVAHRAELFIVSKVLPQNASRKGTLKACEASLKALGCDYLDLYLLHWRGSHSFRDTLQAFIELQQRGLIREFGVSNFDIDDLTEWREAEQALQVSTPARVNQVYYCAQARGIEFDVLPWQHKQGIATIAYSPLGLGDLTRHPTFIEIGTARGCTAAQVALAWVIRHPDVVAIPKSANPQRQEENLRAVDITLSEAELKRIDAAFPPPQRKMSLEMV